MKSIQGFGCMISGFCHDVDEICALLGYYAAQHPRTAQISGFWFLLLQFVSRGTDRWYKILQFG
jgi:hypothetical protein